MRMSRTSKKDNGICGVARAPVVPVEGYILESATTTNEQIFNSSTGDLNLVHVESTISLWWHWLSTRVMYPVYICYAWMEIHWLLAVIIVCESLVFTLFILLALELYIKCRHQRSGSNSAGEGTHRASFSARTHRRGSGGIRYVAVPNGSLRGETAADIHLVPIHPVGAGCVHDVDNISRTTSARNNYYQADI